MIKFKTIASVLFCLAVLFSCKKDNPIDHEPQPEPWEKFVGKYRVYDTVNNSNYPIWISHYEDTSSLGNVRDFLLIENFANNFDLSFIYAPYNPDNIFLSIRFNDSVQDYNGNHWGIFSEWDDSTTIYKENVLQNDTLVFFFKMTNAKFFVQENQPYFFCLCKHIAVKEE